MTPRGLAIVTGEGGELREWRCVTCGSLLFRANVTLTGAQCIESWCKSCKAKVVFVAQPERESA